MVGRRPASGAKTNADFGTVLVELAPAGKFKCRVIENSKGRALDIREYIEEAAYTGFTRKGIFLHSVAQIVAVKEACDVALQLMTEATEPATEEPKKEEVK